MSEQTPDQAPVAVLEYESSGFEQVLAQHKSKLILVGSLLAVGGLSYMGLNFWKEHKATAASRALSKATSVAEWKAAAEEHAGQPGAGTALLMAADKLGSDRPGEAVDLLKKFVAEYPTHPLRDLGALRQAEYMMQSGDKAGAAAAFKELGAGTSAFAAAAKLREGDLKWEEGKIDDALAIYKTIPSSAAAIHAQAEQRVQQVKAKAPAIIPFVEEKPAGTPGAPNDPAAGIVPSIPGAPALNLDAPAPAEGGISLDGAAPAGAEKMLEAEKLPPAPEAPAAPAKP